MKTSRFTEEHIIGFLRQAEAGIPIMEVCLNGGFSDVTFYKWRSKFGGMEAQGDNGRRFGYIRLNFVRSILDISL